MPVVIEEPFDKIGLLRPVRRQSIMALAERIPSLRALNQDRRRHQRVKVNLLGRYMLPDRREFPCQVVNMSPGGMALIAPVSGSPGERIIAYVDHLGRLEGQIARLFRNGFAMTISATARKRDKLAAQADLAGQSPYSRAAGRPAPRPYGAAQPGRPPDPAERRQPHLPDHRRIGIRRRHRQGAAAADRRAGYSGKVQGRVVRHLEDGFAIEFTRLQHPDFLEENICGG